MPVSVVIVTTLTMVPFDDLNTDIMCLLFFILVLSVSSYKACPQVSPSSLLASSEPVLTFQCSIRNVLPRTFCDTPSVVLALQSKIGIRMSHNFVTMLISCLTLILQCGGSKSIIPLLVSLPTFFFPSAFPTIQIRLRSYSVLLDLVTLSNFASFVI